MSGERIDLPARHPQSPIEPTIPRPPTSTSGQWTRRRMVVRLAAALAAAIALPPALSPVLPATARELLPRRNACACGPGRVQAQVQQAGDVGRTNRPQQAVRTFENRVG